MFKLEMKAGVLADLVSKMTARESSGNNLFSPLIVNVDVKKKRIEWSWITADQSAFTYGQARKLKLSGDSGQYVIDAEIVDWVNNLFGTDEKVTMEHRESIIYLKGDKTEAQLSPTDADATRIESASQIKIEDNLPKLPGLKWKEVQLKASEILTILKPTTLVYGQKDIKIVRLTFDKKGSVALIGSLEAHSIGVARPIEAKVKAGFEVILGVNFAEVMTVLSGAIKFYGDNGNKPLWILKETDNLTIGYFVAPYDESQEEEPEIEEPEEEEVPEEDDDGELDLGDDE